MKTVYSYLHTLTTTGETILVLTDGGDRQAQAKAMSYSYDSNSEDGPLVGEGEEGMLLFPADEETLFEVYENSFDEPHVVDIRTALRYIAHDRISLGDPPESQGEKFWGTNIEQQQLHEPEEWENTGQPDTSEDDRILLTLRGMPLTSEQCQAFLEGAKTVKRRGDAEAMHTIYDVFADDGHTRPCRLLGALTPEQQNTVIERLRALWR